MAKQAPNPIDIQEFQFKLLCRLKVFLNDDKSVFNKPCNLLASASRFGLVFVGTNTPNFQVIQISNIETYTQKEAEIIDYSRRLISIPSPPKHLSVNCDNTKLAVVIEKNGCAVAIIYDTPSFLKQNISAIQEIRLSTSPGVSITETAWNPTIPNIFTACKEDGSVGLYEFKETGLDIKELPPESQALCMCWSPKGKQLAVGSSNGKITQYKPDLKAMKVIQGPPLDGAYSVVAIQWISSFQFIVLYKFMNMDTSALLVVDAPKTGDVSYINYEDICYSYGNVRPVQFYTVHQSIWNILVVASSNSMEVGVLGSDKEQWTQWILADTARAELPLSLSKQETLPIGLAFDISAAEPIIWGEHTLPPAPFLFLLSDHGVLCCFRVINMKSGVTTICQPPEPLVDTSGLNLFTNTSHFAADNITTSEAPKQAAAVPIQITPLLPKEPPPSLQPVTPPTDLSTPKETVSFATVPVKPMFPPVAASSSIFGSPVNSQSNLSTKFNTSQTMAVPSFDSHASTGSKTTSSLSTNTVVPTVQPNESKIIQEEADFLISKLIREECEALEKELSVVLQKGNSLKIELGTDAEAVQLVRETDSMQKFLKEVVETCTVQASEVHSLKQGLIQTWAWYEDSRSRYMQIQDATLDTLFRIQQLDPVSQRYLANIQHLTYYLESQLIQATRVLDEQWENFQDSCKKISRIKIPTIEAIYQTMVRQSAIHQKQKYVLKDISSRIRAQRSKINGRSLFVCLNNAERLEQDLMQLQLDPQNIFYAQYERVVETRNKLTTSKVQKLGKLLLERDITHVSVNKPQLSNTSLQTLLNNSTQIRRNDESTVFGAAFSPIPSNKLMVRATGAPDIIQSTPKPASVQVEKKEITTEDLPVGISPKMQSPALGHTALSSSNKTDVPSSTVLTGFDFSTNSKKSFFTPSNSQTNVSSGSPSIFTFTQPAQTGKSKPETTITPIHETTSDTTSSTPNQFNFTSGTSASFTSLFGKTKPVISTKSNTADLPKLVPSSVSSAFVPTTQLAFTFSAKSNISTTPSLSITQSKTPAFNFTMSETSQTPVLAKSEPFMGFTASTKNVTSPKTLTSDSTSVPPVRLFKTPVTVSATAMIPVGTQLSATKFTTTQSAVVTKAVDVSTTVFSTVSTTTTSAVVSKSTDKQSFTFNQGSVFSFSNASTTQNSIFSFKPAVSQPNPSSTQAPLFEFSKIAKENAPSPSIKLTTTASIFAPVTKTTTQASIFGNTTTTAALSTFGAVTITTSSKSVFTPVMTTSADSITSKEPDSSGTISLFGSPVSNNTNNLTTPIFGSTSGFTTTTSGLNVGSSTTTTSSASTVFGNTTSTTTTTSIPIFTASSSLPTVPETTSTITSITSPTFVQPATTNSLFTASASSPNSVFAPALFGTTTNSVFSQPTTTVSPVFAQPATTLSSIFAQPTTTVASVFGSSKPSAFGEVPKTASSPFGSPTNSFENAQAFDKPIFGSTSVFGTSPSTTTNIFGAANPTATTFGSNTSIFGNAPTGAGGFSQQNSTFSFSAAAANIPNSDPKFGFSKPPFGFGASQVNADGSAFSFNNLSMGVATTTASSPLGSTFGQSSNANPFAKPGSQEPKPVFGGGSLFGATPSVTTSSIFGGGSNSVFGSPTAPTFGSPSGFASPSSFGQTSAFGQTPAFGNSFGSPQSAGPFSGGNQSVAQTGFGAFGQAQQKSPGFGGAAVFGGSPSGFGSPPAFGSNTSAFGAAPAFGSPSKVFGEPPTATGAFSGANQQQNSTFANLATQNTLGFGSLAQQSQTLSNQSPFSSGSSFSTWR